MVETPARPELSQVHLGYFVSGPCAALHEVRYYLLPPIGHQGPALSAVHNLAVGDGLNFTKIDMFLVARVISPSGAFERREREREEKRDLLLGRVLTSSKKCEPSGSIRPPNRRR